MQSTPQANRLTIAFFGRRNAGKSSLINALTGQEVSLVSEVPGSTADPVAKSMELLPLGPITVIDTAGLDDQGELGQQKVRRAQDVLNRADIAVLVTEATNPDKGLELAWIKTMAARQMRLLVVENKIDLLTPENLTPENWLPPEIPRVQVSATTGAGLNSFKEALITQAAQAPTEESLIAGLFPRGSLFLLITPQDLQAPKGRLILPQVQVLRDILDHHSLALIASFNELDLQLQALTRPPDLIITDSQLFGAVVKRLDPKLPLTSFSIIMARAKGELKPLVAGARHLDQLKPGDRVLLAEACTHHALKNDIAREQIPRLIQEKVGGEIHFEISSGHDFVKQTQGIDLIIACGGCMITGKHFLSGMEKADQAGVPMTNFGLILAHLNGSLDRAVAIFESPKE